MKIDNVCQIVQEELSDAKEIVEAAKKKVEQGVNALDDLEAISFFEEAVDLVPDYVDAWNKMGEVYCKLSLLSKAKSCFNKVIKINHHNVEALLGLGTVYHRLEIYKCAIYEYECALDEEPENLRAWFGLAAVHKDTQCYMQAIECWEKILDIMQSLEKKE